MDLSIIIVNYRTKHDLERCLTSLEKLTDNLSKEIIVVDNASYDGSSKLILEKFPNVIFIQNTVNEGLSKANNKGAMQGKGDFYLFLNPDTVIEGATLLTLLNFLRSTPDAGLLGAKLVYPDGTLQLSCRNYYSIRTLILRRTFLGRLFPDSKILKKHLLTDWDHNSIRTVDWLLGACLMIPRSVFKKVGGFDEKYKLYFEDVDLCRRVNDIGFRVYYYPFISIVHHHRRDSAKVFSIKWVWHLKSAIRYFNKFGWNF